VKPAQQLLALATAALLLSPAAHAVANEQAVATSDELAVAPASDDAVPTEPAASADSAEPDVPFGFRVSHGPLTINSEELDAEDRDGQRKIVFRQNVEARQGDLRVTCGELEALYPAGASQPSRLVARQNVRLAQGDQQVWCDEASFDRVAETLTCRGHGRFLDGDNELRGDEIEIDLKRETVRVRGQARVVIVDEAPPSTAPAAVAP
jgi:lipopolysaccharide transport protein LptA